MFEVEKIFSFEAGHTLEHHKGLCSKPHGHSYTIKVAVRRENLSKEGMVIDFGDIAAIVKPMIENYFDHCWLNESLQMEDPTAEHMAKWIFDYLKPKLEGLYRVSVHETQNCSASYFIP